MCTQTAWIQEFRNSRIQGCILQAMKIKKSLSSLLIYAVVFPQALGLAADIPAEWQGLWALIQETDSGPVSLFLWLPGEKGRAELMTDSWHPLKLARWSVQGEDLRLNMLAKGTNTGFSGVRKGKRFDGKWTLVHPQYRVEGALTGRLITASQDWTPLGFSDPGNLSTNVIDMAAGARKAKQDGNLPEFSARYFSLYNKLIPPSSLERTIETSSYQASSAAIERGVKEIIEMLSQTFPGYSLPLDIVLLPTGEAVASRTIQSKLFVAINPDKFELPADPLQSKIRLAQTLLTEAVNHLTPPVRAASVDFMKSALPLAWMKTLKISNDNATLLQVSPAEYAAVRENLASLKKDAKKRKPMSLLEHRIVAMAFADFLGESAPPTRTSTFDAPSITARFDEFIASPE